MIYNGEEIYRRINSLIHLKVSVLERTDSTIIVGPNGVIEIKPKLTEQQKINFKKIDEMIDILLEHQKSYLNEKRKNRINL